MFFLSLSLQTHLRIHLPVLGRGSDYCKQLFVYTNTELGYFIHVPVVCFFVPWAQIHFCFFGCLTWNKRPPQPRESFPENSGGEFAVHRHRGRAARGQLFQAELGSRSDNQCPGRFGDRERDGGHGDGNRGMRGVGLYC